MKWQRYLDEWYPIPELPHFHDNLLHASFFLSDLRSPGDSINFEGKQVHGDEGPVLHASFFLSDLRSPGDSINFEGKQVHGDKGPVNNVDSQWHDYFYIV